MLLLILLAVALFVGGLILKKRPKVFEFDEGDFLPWRGILKEERQ